MEEFTDPLRASLEAAGFQVRVEGNVFFVSDCRFRVYMNRSRTVRLYCDGGDVWRSGVMRRRKNGYDLMVAVQFILFNLPTLLERKEQMATVEEFARLAKQLDDIIAPNRQGLHVRNYGAEFELSFRTTDYGLLCVAVDYIKDLH